MILLTNKETVSKILQVAIGYNEKEFDVFVKEAQEFDLKPLLCEQFYSDLIHFEFEKTKDLIEGGCYNYNGAHINFRGLKDVLCYFTYARFILKSNVVSTSHGFVIKKTPHSEPITLEERRNFYYSYRKDANIIFEDVKKYIERNLLDFPSWKCDSNCDKPIKTTFKTRVIQ